MGGGRLLDRQRVGADHDRAVLGKVFRAFAVQSRRVVAERHVRPTLHLTCMDQDDIAWLELDALLLHAVLNVLLPDRVTRREDVNAMKRRDVEQHAAREDRGMFLRAAAIPAAAAEMVGGAELLKILPL
jgi:hypothetical protein